MVTQTKRLFSVKPVKKNIAAFYFYILFSSPYLRSDVVKGTVGGDDMSVFWVSHWVPPFISIL